MIEPVALLACLVDEGATGSVFYFLGDPGRIEG